MGSTANVCLCVHALKEWKWKRVTKVLDKKRNIKLCKSAHYLNDSKRYSSNSSSSIHTLNRNNKKTQTRITSFEIDNRTMCRLDFFRLASATAATLCLYTMVMLFPSLLTTNYCCCCCYCHCYYCCCSHAYISANAYTCVSNSHTYIYKAFKQFSINNSIAFDTRTNREKARGRRRESKQTKPLNFTIFILSQELFSARRRSHLLDLFAISFYLFLCLLLLILFFLSLYLMAFWGCVCVCANLRSK